jgi:hypothetical protein
MGSQRANAKLELNWTGQRQFVADVATAPLPDGNAESLTHAPPAHLGCFFRW